MQQKYKDRAAVLLPALMFTTSLYAQTDPWTSSTQAVSTAFTGPIGTALTLVAIVIAGLTFQFSEGGGKKTIAGVVFGTGMTINAARFLSWLTA